MPQSTPRPSTRAESTTSTLDWVTFGRRLRVARKQFGWTLAQLAQLADMSITTLSRAERGQLALSYEKIAALGRTLQMDLGALFAVEGADVQPMSGPVVTRAGKGVAYEGVSVSYEFLGTTATGKEMCPMFGTVHGRRINGPEDFARHPGEEFVYVISGVVEVHFDGAETVQLHKGDSLYFDSTIGHAYVSMGPRLAKILGVTSSSTGVLRLRRQDGV